VGRGCSVRVTMRSGDFGDWFTACPPASGPR
jgi:hypothetical protein